ncbi:hypothetical protein ACFYTQ_26225 [Nocardia sp. NPDC004068]|uniref:hypothetical protein n=1 Tax=Nocardia sp. NPDC004068 TaxID=3364303 RepID=UPI00368EBBC7
MTIPQLIRADDLDRLPHIITGSGIESERPVLTVVGGAAGMTDDAGRGIAEIVSRWLVPLLERLRVTVVDGGTHAGIMRLLGEARTEAHASFPLIGVAAAGTVALPDVVSAVPDAAPPDPGHTHLVLVPGHRWGDESPWLSAVASVIAGTRPSATLLVNGGSLTIADAGHSLDVSRPILVLEGSGRVADRIAEARRLHNTAPDILPIVESPLVDVISIAKPELVVANIQRLLGAK